MFIHPHVRVSFSHESTNLLASSQFLPPVSFNLSQLVNRRIKIFGWMTIWIKIKVRTKI